MTRDEALADLLTPEHQETVLGLLLATNRDLRIAVPCSVLSKGAGGAGTKVQVTVVRRTGTGPSLALDCGRWWRGAPTSAVHMDYRQLLEHVNDDALRILHKKLMDITKSRSRGLARTRSVPGRILFEEMGSAAGSSGGSSGRLQRTSSMDPPAGGGLQRTSSVGPPAGGLQRTSSTGLPPSGPSALRRTSSLGMPAESAGGNSRRTSQHGRGPAGLHRLSVPAVPRAPSSIMSSSSLATSLASSPAESDDEIVTPEKLVQAAAEASSNLAGAFERTPAQAAASTGKAAVLGGTRLSLEDSAGPRAAPSTSRLSPGLSPEASSWASWQSTPGSPAGSTLGLGGSVCTSPSASTPLSTASPADLPSCSPSPADSQGVGVSTSSSALSRQPTFSQPYFAQFEEEEEAECRAAAAAAAVPAGSVTPRAAPATQAAGSANNSGSVRAAQLLAVEEQMTAEELHEVAASFNHVFVPPWAVPQAPAQEVHTFREAGVQTSTGVAGDEVAVRSTHTADDAQDHFEAFMQHFSASLPHLAMALADMHLVRGGEDHAFIKSQFYFNSLLLLRDEMRQLQDRISPAGGSSK